MSDAAMEAPTFQPPADLDGYWQWDPSHFPKPVSFLHRTIGLILEERAFRDSFAEFSLPLKTVEFRILSGYCYMRVHPLGGRRPLPGAFRQLWRLHPAMRRRMRGCVEAVRSGRHRRLLEDWNSRLRDEVREELEGFLRTDLSALDDPALLAHTDRAVDRLTSHVTLHFALHWAMSLPIARLAWACARLPDDPDLRMARLLAGLSPMSIEPAVQLARLAREVADDEGLRAVVMGPPSANPLAALAEAAPEFTQRFESYLDRFGHRVVNRYDVAERTLAEQPETILEMLREYVRTGYDPASELARQAEERRAAEEETLALLPDAAARERFVHVLEEARYAYPVRDDNVFYTITMPLAVARYLFLHVGERLVARGVLDGREQVFLLTYDEALAGLKGQLPSMRAAVAARAAELAEQGRITPPRSLGERPAPPDLGAFPPEVQEATAALAYYMERVFAQGVGAAGAGSARLSGVAASPGAYRGTARVILHEADFDRLQQGDVLICPTTTPTWSVLFSKVAALVTDSGGVLSHPAIIAREYGIPAVVATGRATAVIEDGRTVLVDGTAGTVTVE